MENIRERSGWSNQVLPSRPLPAVWWRASTTSPSGAPSSARRKASSFVDPRLTWVSTGTPRKRVPRAVLDDIDHQKREVERRGRVRERPDRDVLHARNRELADVLE